MHLVGFIIRIHYRLSRHDKKFFHYGNLFGFSFGISLTKVNLKFKRIGIEPVFVQTS